MFYRYFCRKKRPSDLIPLQGIRYVVDYEEPIDSGNGKKMYGYVDYDRPLNEAETVQLGLEAAAVNPIDG